MSTATATPTTPPRLTVGFREIPLAQLVESPTNPRTYFDAKYLAELAESIKAHGVVQPIVVRRSQANMREDRFEVVAGACRYRASKLAGEATIPATIRELSDEQVIEIQIVENLQRKDVHPLDEATGYERLVAMGFEVEAIAAKVGKSVSYVYQRIQLGKLIEPAKKAFREDKLSAGHAVLIARLQSKQQKEALDFCDNEYRKPGVRQLMVWIDEHVHLDLHSTPWKKDDAQLLPKAGACTNCSKRTGSQPQLFEDIGKKDVCTDPVCFHAKADAFFALVKKEAKAAGQELVEISTHEYSWNEDKKHRRQGVIYGEDYREAHKHCEYARAGVVVSGKGRGGIRQICTNKKCPTHWPKAVSDYNPRTGQSRTYEQKKQAEAEARRQATQQVLGKIKTVKTEDYRFIAHAMLGEMWSDRVTELAKALAIEPKRKKHGGQADYEDAVGTFIDTVKPADLPKLLMHLALYSRIASPDWHRENKSVYEAMLKRYKVDRKKLQAKILAELKAKAKAKTQAAKKKVQTSAKKKRAK